MSINRDVILRWNATPEMALGLGGCLVALVHPRRGEHQLEGDRRSPADPTWWSRMAIMNNNGRPGFVHRAWTALSAALKRGLLGKSSHDYMKQFTGSDEYFEEAIAAQQGWSGRQVSKANTVHAYERVHSTRTEESKNEKKTTADGGEKTAQGPQPPVSQAQEMRPTVAGRSLLSQAFHLWGTTANADD